MTMSASNVPKERRCSHVAALEGSETIHLMPLNYIEVISNVSDPNTPDLWLG